MAGNEELLRSATSKQPYASHLVEGLDVGSSRTDVITQKTTILAQFEETRIVLQEVTLQQASGDIVTYCQKCTVDLRTGLTTCKIIECPKEPTQPPNVAGARE